MKAIINGLILTLCAASMALAQEVEGAWKWEGTSESGDPIMAVSIIQDQYFAVTWYDLEGKKFISTNGGTWTMSDTKMTQKIEWNSSDSEQVGQEVIFTVTTEGDQATIQESGDVWMKIDSNSPGDLAGAWLITGRKRDGEITERDPNRPRKTMKILSGTRFQWIAYNTETKEFLGSGGGTYTTEDGKYTENIEFFSRDNTRVGAKLGFDFSLQDGAWHHSGNSSKGNPIYEIWRPREM